jgi:hypothetical protein
MVYEQYVYNPISIKRSQWAQEISGHVRQMAVKLRML